LVRSEKRGRVRTVRVEEPALEGAQDWIAEQRTIWRKRLDPMDDYLIRMKEMME
jgi:hypothetical protein